MAILLTDVSIIEGFYPQPLSPGKHPTLQQRNKQTCVSPQKHGQSSNHLMQFSTQRPKTSLNLLVNVPEGFFSTSFFMLGILLSISKNFARVRLEERAWEQRLAEGRERALKKDPTLTELDLRRAEAATEWSAYGAPRMMTRERRTSRVAVVDRMNDQDIQEFEREYGVAYDPYYDDPYEEDELPEGTFEVDRMYGDRIYDDGEIFYKDSKSGLFYRQGSKPRNFRFFG